MAEGILNAALKDDFRIASAGSQPAGHVHPLAVEVLAEIGIEISHHRSKHLDEFLKKDVETVITVCGNADSVCPLFPGQVNRHHFPFSDPGHTEGGEAEILAAFRSARDEIRRVLEAYAAGRIDGTKQLPRPMVVPA